MTAQQMLILAIVGGLAGGVLWSAFTACANALAARLTAWEEREARIGAARARAARPVEVGARSAGADLDSSTYGHG